MSYPTHMTASPGLPFLDITRDFDAPAETVFRAHTDAELFARWTGPCGMHVHIVDWEARVGGRWKYEFRGDGDQLYSFRGVFHTVEPSTLIIQTFEFSAAPGEAGISSSVFEAIDGRTRLLMHEVYPSIAARDAALASGMEYGVREGYDRLDELLVAARS